MPVKTLEGWSSKAFLRQKAGKFPKKRRKAERERRSKGGSPWTSHRFLRLSAISAVECARRPCAATTTPEKMESAQAQRRRGRRGGGLDCESSADPCAHREVRSRGYEIRSAKWRAE